MFTNRDLGLNSVMDAVVDVRAEEGLHKCLDVHDRMLR